MCGAKNSEPRTAFVEAYGTTNQTKVAVAAQYRGTMRANRLAKNLIEARGSPNRRSEDHHKTRDDKEKIDSEGAI